MAMQDFWTKRFYEYMDAAKADAATIKEFIDNDIELTEDQVSRFDLGHAKMFADELHRIAQLVAKLKERRKEV